MIRNIVLLCLISSMSHGHEGHAHKKPLNRALLNSINSSYLRDIKPIFQRSCFDCHSSQTQYPWYYKLPGAKQLIDSDIEEARKHLDMDNDFPFVSHATPIEDLQAIKKTTKEASMPPFRYRVLHKNSSLSMEDKKIILDWADNSLILLQK